MLYDSFMSLEKVLIPLLSIIWKQFFWKSHLRDLFQKVYFKLSEVYVSQFWVLMIFQRSAPPPFSTCSLNFHGGATPFSKPMIVDGEIITGRDHCLLVSNTCNYKNKYRVNMASQTINLHQNFKQVLILCTLFHTHIYYTKIRLWGKPKSGFCRKISNVLKSIILPKFIFGQNSTFEIVCATVAPTFLSEIFMYFSYRI